MQYQTLKYNESDSSLKARFLNHSFLAFLVGISAHSPAVPTSKSLFYYLSDKRKFQVAAKGWEKFSTIEFQKADKEGGTSNMYAPLIIILLESSTNEPTVVKTW